MNSQMSKLLLNAVNGVKNICKMSTLSNIQTLKITTPKPFVYHVELNRPEKMNAMNRAMRTEIQACFEELGSNPDCRAIVLSGAGKLFCAGIDFQDFMHLGQQLAEHEDIARKAAIIHSNLVDFQRNLTAIESNNKPVIAAIHNGCIGAGVDMITSTCIRYCSKDSYFQVKEIQLGMAADVGTLQRLPKLIGNQGLVRELCYTGRIMKADEALSSGVVSKVFADKESLINGAIEVAEQIAKLSPVAVQTTKKSLLYARDHSVQDALNEIGIRNQFLLQSEDFLNAVTHVATKQEGDIAFSKL